VKHFLASAERELLAPLLVGGGTSERSERRPSIEEKVEKNMFYEDNMPPRKQSSRPRKASRKPRKQSSRPRKARSPKRVSRKACKSSRKHYRKRSSRARAVCTKKPGPKRSRKASRKARKSSRKGRKASSRSRKVYIPRAKRSAEQQALLGLSKEDCDAKGRNFVQYVSKKTGELVRSSCRKTRVPHFNYRRAMPRGPKGIIAEVDYLVRRQAYRNPNHPQHKQSVDRVARLAKTYQDREYDPALMEAKVLELEFEGVLPRPAEEDASMMDDEDVYSQEMSNMAAQF
jgi:hypothetical protein